MLTRSVSPAQHRLVCDFFSGEVVVMFGLFTRRRTRPRPQGRVRLSLESLEPRACPSALHHGLAIAAVPAAIGRPGHSTAEASGHSIFSAHAVGVQISGAALARTHAISARLPRTVSVSPPVSRPTTARAGAGTAASLHAAIAARGLSGPRVLRAMRRDATTSGTMTTTTTSGTTTTTSTSTTTSPLQITSFQATEGPAQMWTFKGQVTDSAQNPTGFVVTMGGLPSLDGKTDTVQSDGSFCLSIQLQTGEDGTATAQTTNGAGINSNVADAMVRQTS